MIKIGVLFVLLTMLAACGNRGRTKACKPDKASEASFEMDSEMFDFGDIKYGEIVGKKIRFANNGSDYLQIFEIESGCACTTVECRQKMLSPGSTGTLNVIFDTKGLRGRQFKTILIRTNCGREPKRLSFSANIINE